MNRIVVAVNAASLAIVKSILHLTDNIHPDIHVGSSLLDGLCATAKAVPTEISVTICKARLASGESSKDPLVGVIKYIIVLAELLIVGVRAVGAFVHLSLRFSAETGKRAPIVVVGVNVVVVSDGIAESVNGQSSITRKTLGAGGHKKGA